MIYVYDGTWDGLMCLVYRTALDERFPEDVLRRSDTADQALLFDALTVESDPGISAATAELLKKRAHPRIWSEIWFALLSGAKGVDAALLRVLERLWRTGRYARIDLLDPHFELMRVSARRTGMEYEKYLGLLRFQDTGGILYARMEPECDILPLLAGHFSRRFPRRGWVIHDIRLDRAVLCDGTTWHIQDLSLSQIPRVTRDEEKYQELWREFYRAATTRQRLNYSVQRTHMPKKYWKHLVETPGEFHGKTPDFSSA